MGMGEPHVCERVCRLARQTDKGYGRDGLGQGLGLAPGLRQGLGLGVDASQSTREVQSLQAVLSTLQVGDPPCASPVNIPPLSLQAVLSTPACLSVIPLVLVLII